MDSTQTQGIIQPADINAILDNLNTFREIADTNSYVRISRNLFDGEDALEQATADLIKEFKDKVPIQGELEQEILRVITSGVLLGFLSYKYAADEKIIIDPKVKKLFRRNYKTATEFIHEKAKLASKANLQEIAENA